MTPKICDAGLPGERARDWPGIPSLGVRRVLDPLLQARIQHDRGVAAGLPLGLPSQQFGETQLEEHLGTSRTPVREALRRLEADGLIVGSHRGVVVAELERSEIAHAFEVRATLEAMTAQSAARRVREGQVAVAALDELRRLASVTASATSRGELAAAVSANRDFHRAIAGLAGNPLALDILDRLWDRLTVSARISLEPVRRRREVNDEHDRLVAAIAAGDAGEAGSLARDHVEATLESLAGSLEPAAAGRRLGR